MRMILKKFLCEQITCDKFITTQWNKYVTILQSQNQSIKNIKVTLREGEALICVKKYEYSNKKWNYSLYPWNMQKKKKNWVKNIKGFG